MISADTLRLLMEVGVTGEALLRVTESIEKDNAQNVTPVTPNAARQARFRARQRALKALRNNVTRNVTALPPDKERSPGPPKEINSPPVASLRSATSRLREDTAEFLEFWTAYPHKIGKGDARKAWPRAIEKAGSLAVILDGLQRYKRAKPPPPDGPPWCNPATFLNQERWADQPLYTNGKNDGEVLYKFSTVEEVMAEIESERKAANGG